MGIWRGRPATCEPLYQRRGQEITRKYGRTNSRLEVSGHRKSRSQAKRKLCLSCVWSVSSFMFTGSTLLVLLTLIAINTGQHQSTKRMHTTECQCCLDFQGVMVKRRLGKTIRISTFNHLSNQNSKTIQESYSCMPILALYH